MNILIMGPGGSGKGTMAKKIVELFKVTQVATGDMFRDAIKGGTEVGMEAKKYIDQGRLVPDDVTNRMVKERLAKPDCSNGYLLDGFPRSVVQAQALEKMTETIGRPVDVVINLVIHYDVLITRVVGRRICEECGAIYHMVNHPPKVEGICDLCGGKLYHRTDDTEEMLKPRFEEYTKLTKPTIDYYRAKNMVYDVDADRNASAVMEDIVEILEKYR